MSDFDEFEFNSDDVGDIEFPGDKKDNENKPPNNSSDNKNDDDDDFKLPELPQAKQKNLSVINFSALKPATGSSITISDAPNDSLNFSRPPLLPARLTSMMSTPSQNQTSAPEEENKPKFELPPLFDDLDDDDDDSNGDQPNLGPIQFPTDLDKKDTNNNVKESKEKMDSITINSVSNNTSLFTNKLMPDSPLKNDNFPEVENTESNNNDNNLNNSMKPKFMQDLSLSQNNDKDPLDNFGDDIDTPHPLIPSRKALSTSSFQSQSPIKLNHSASKPSFLNINEIKNIKPVESINNNDLSSIATKSPEKPLFQDPFPTTATSDAQKNEVKNIDDNNDDDNIEFSSMSLSLSDDEKPADSKQNLTENKTNDKSNVQAENKTPPISAKINSNPSSGQKQSQIQMTNDSQSAIPSQSKLAPSSLNDTDFNNNFFYESETEQSKSQEQNESDKEKTNQSVFHTSPSAIKTFQSFANDETSDDLNQKEKKEDEIVNENHTNSNEQQKRTPQNSKSNINQKSTETKKIKTELAESAQKVKQSIKQSASKQQQKKPVSNESMIKTENQQKQQIISPPIRNTNDSPLSTSQSPSPLESPPNSSSGSFRDQEQEKPNVNNKTQTMVNMTKTEDQLSSVSLHMSSEQPTKKRVTKMAIEIGVEKAFDQSSAQFKRLFLNEFESLMRPTYQMPYDTDIDTFVDYLSKDINKELSSITKSYSPTSRKIRGLSEKIDLMFDQGKDALNEKLANSYEDDLQRRATNYQKLRNLQSMVDDLNKTFSSKITKTLKVIDNFLNDSALVRSNKLMKAQLLQKNMRELTLTKMHLEAKINRQINEFEEIDRRQNEVLMSYMSFLNEPDFYDDDDDRSIILKKIARSITMISSDIDRLTYEGLTEMSNDGQFQINEERTKIRDEYAKLDGIAEKLKYLKQANASKKTSSKRKESKKKKI